MSQSKNEIVPKVGRVYRAKKPRPIGVFDRLYDDRQVVWLGIDQVQYDGPAVKIGRKRPIVPLARFIKWAERDVTDELPPGEWAPYGRSSPA